MIKYPLYVTIDTNIFEANQFDFGADSTMSLLVKNVQNGKIKLVLSNIVISEVEKHLCSRVDSVCGKARKLRKEYLDLLPEQYLTDIGMGLYVQIPKKEPIHQRAKEVFERFLNDCKVERLDTSSINLENILENYFAVCPPFENSEKKRKEFPDAFIAEEIKKRFGNDEVVAIISQDKGFKNACGDSENHLFFSSLGELYNLLSKNEEMYAAALESIKSNHDSIIQKIKEMIDDNCIEVCGLSYDKDGIPEGYDYSETFLEHCDLLGTRLHIIDDIDGDIITASLWIHGKITMNCYFEDFDNSPWDPEEKEYVYVDVKHILEKHDARFACRIELNSKTNDLRVLPFKIILGGDSRKSREEIDDEQATSYNDLEDADREELGFVPLSQYGDFLSDNLNSSDMAQKMLELFEYYNDISLSYEDLSIRYDEICSQVKNEMTADEAKTFIAKLSFNKGIPIDFSDKNNDETLNEIIMWLDTKSESLFERSERKLPDYIEYGENINIFGVNSKSYTLSFEELLGIPEIGSEESIEVTLWLGNETIAKGYVKLTIGYINYDEDGGVTDGIEDSIDYEVDNVLIAINELILELKEELDSEQKLASFLEKCLKQNNEYKQN